MDDAFPSPAPLTGIDSPEHEATLTPDPVAVVVRPRVRFQKGRIMKTRHATVQAGLVPTRLPPDSTIMTLAMTRHATEVQNGTGACKIIRPLPQRPVGGDERNEFTDDAGSPSWGPDHVASFVEQVHDQARTIEDVVETMRDNDKDSPNSLVVRTLCSQGVNRGPMLAHCLAGALRKRGVLHEGEACNDVPPPQRGHILAYTRAFVEAPEGEEVQAMLATEAEA